MNPCRPDLFGRLWSFAVAVVLLASASSGVARTQLATSSELKAAFVFNFVRFTDWPSDVIETSSPIVVCLMDDTGVAGAFEQIVRGRTAGNRGIQARWIRKDADVRTCHVVYLSGIDAKRSEDLILRLNGTAILTISDDEQFAERGGIANFFVEHDKMGFAVNVKALQRARLQISAKLLSLARIVRR